MRQPRGAINQKINYSFLQEMAQAISHIPLTLQQQYHLSSAATDRTNKSALITLAVIKVCTFGFQTKQRGPK